MSDEIRERLHSSAAFSAHRVSTRDRDPRRRRYRGVVSLDEPEPLSEWELPLESLGPLGVADEPERSLLLVVLVLRLDCLWVRVVVSLGLLVSFGSLPSVPVESLGLPVPIVLPVGLPALEPAPAPCASATPGIAKAATTAPIFAIFRICRNICSSCRLGGVVWRR